MLMFSATGIMVIALYKILEITYFQYDKTRSYSLTAHKFLGKKAINCTIELLYLNV